MLTTESTLLERLRQPGDNEAWRRFAALYTPLLLHWARQRGLQQADAVDLAQEILLVVCREMPMFQYDPSRRFRGWLRTIAVNKANELHQRQGKDALASGSRVGRLFAPEEQAFWEREYRDRLFARALQIVQSKFEETTWRAALELLMSGRPARDVSQELGITEAAVYQARSRVLRRLRQDLQGLWE